MAAASGASAASDSSNALQREQHRRGGWNNGYSATCVVLNRRTWRTAKRDLRCFVAMPNVGAQTIFVSGTTAIRLLDTGRCCFWAAVRRAVRCLPFRHGRDGNALNCHDEQPLGVPLELMPGCARTVLPFRTILRCTRYCWNGRAPAFSWNAAFRCKERVNACIWVWTCGLPWAWSSRPGRGNLRWGPGTEQRLPSRAYRPLTISGNLPYLDLCAWASLAKIIVGDSG